MPDPFSSHATALDSPARRAASVTPADGTDLTTTARALWVGGGGNITLDTAGGDTVTIPNIPDGAVLPVTARRIRSTGTTATNIVALW